LFGIHALIMYVLGHRHGSIDADVVIFPLGGIALHQAGESLVLSFLSNPIWKIGASGTSAGSH
jgi:hypothetical protein